MRMFSLPIMSVFVAVGSSMSLAVQPTQAGGIDGVWSGPMRQVDVSAEKTYPMTLTFKGGKGYSEYPDLKCGGLWKRIGTAPGGYAVYAEKITHGAEVVGDAGGCIDGIITVSVKGDRAVLGWFASVDGEPSLASAVLTRRTKSAAH